MGQVTDYAFFILGLIALIVLLSINRKLRTFNKLLKHNNSQANDEKRIHSPMGVDFSKFKKEREKYLQESRRYSRHHSAHQHHSS